MTERLTGLSSTTRMASYLDAAQACLLVRVGRRRRGAGGHFTWRQLHVETEDTAHARRARGRGLSAHTLHKSTRDGESSPTRRTAGGGHVDLHKGLEQPWQRLRIDADAGVFDFNTTVSALPKARTSMRPPWVNLTALPTRLSKTWRSLRITHPLSHGGVDVSVERDLLSLRSVCHEREDVGDDLLWMRRDPLKFHHVGFGAAEVEEVIEQAHHGLR